MYIEVNKKCNKLNICLNVLIQAYTKCKLKKHNKICNSQHNFNDISSFQSVVFGDVTSKTQEICSLLKIKISDEQNMVGTSSIPHKKKPKCVLSNTLNFQDRNCKLFLFFSWSNNKDLQ